MDFLNSDQFSCRKIHFILLITLLYVGIALGRALQNRTRSKLKEVFDSISYTAQGVGAMAGVADTATVSVVKRVTGLASVLADTASNMGIVGFQAGQGIVDKVVLGND